MKELSNCIIRGESPLFVINSLNYVLDKRLSSLDKFIQSDSRQLNQYMILYEYLKKGYTRYMYLAIGESCDDCVSLDKQIFNIVDAEVGVNLQPMHPNCDCQTAILDNDGNIAALLLNDSLMKNKGISLTKAINTILDVIQTALDFVGLIPGVGEIADGTNAAIYVLRGDYINAGLSGAAMIPNAGWAATGGKFVNKGAKLIKSADDITDAAKAIRNAEKVVDEFGGVGKVGRSFGELINDIEQNPNNWKKVGESIVDSTKKGNAGGKSIEEIFTNENGETIYKHTLTDANGKLIEKPHYRPYGKQ